MEKTKANSDAGLTILQELSNELSTALSSPEYT